ncbi:Alpha-mannosidase [Actinosynnema pretiosum subsp. pretiosum]|nr:Alpha-mannosidase [Actinosynnema pretiosum subsp. pretiosum]
MDDGRSLVERRLARVLDERLRPAVPAETRPLSVARWHAGAAPVPVAGGARRRLRAHRHRRPVGSARAELA